MLFLLNSLLQEKFFVHFLKQFIPSEIFENYPTFVLHPGIIGDRGHNSLDNAINDEVKQWGVVILKANEILDGGDIYAQSNFIMREESSKASIYRNEVTQSTLKALEQFLQNFQPQSREEISLILPLKFSEYYQLFL